MASDEPRYDAVIFDAGGTLIGFHEPAPFQEFLVEAGLPASSREARRFQHRYLDVVHANRDDAQGLGADEGEIDVWWRGIFRQTWPDRPDLAEEMFRWFRADRFDRVFADAVPALNALQEQGMAMGVVSNFTSVLEDLLRRLGLRDYFGFVIVSAQTGIAKPDPRIFDLAVSHLGRPRHRLLYVGDHFGDDIEGALRAGLDAVLIDRGGSHSEEACSRIDSLMDLVPYVRWPEHPARAIIFDMDGVVLDSMPTHLRTWQRTLAPLGIEMTADDLYPLEGIPTELTAQRLTEQFLGQSCSDEEAQNLANTKRALFRDIFEPAFVPGIVPLLHDLRGRGYRLGLVTGSARCVVDESLAPPGTDELRSRDFALRRRPALCRSPSGSIPWIAPLALFDAVVAGDEVSQGKPHPEPYQTAASRMGFAPSECLAVENAPLGVRSAKAAGMTCVALETTLPAVRLPGADHAFSDARALRAWLLSH